MGEFAPLLTNFSAPTLLGAVFLLVMFGGLVPIRVVRRMLADKDALIAEQRAAIAVLTRNNNALLRTSDATVHVLESTGEVVGGSTDVDVV